MKRTCDNCVYCDVSATEQPCVDCDGPNCRFKPREEGMGEKTYTMTFTTAKIDDDALKTITGETEPDYKEELKKAHEELMKAHEELMEAHETIEHKNLVIDRQRYELATMRGKIKGMKFALRCNGVSGGKVR